MGNFDQSKYVSQYSRENYDTLRFIVYKGNGKRIKQLALDKGISMSALIVNALEKTYNLDLSKIDRE